MSSIRIEFTEPVQPLSIGPSLFGARAPDVSTLVKIEFGPSTQRTEMPFALRPVSVFDLSVYELVPAFNFPGAGSNQVTCGTFSEVTVTVNSPIAPDTPLLRDLASNNGEFNTNVLGVTTSFETGQGPGIVNAPVAPDTVLIARVGAQAGLSVVDLNGFGQSTGNPLYDADEMIEGYSNFPNNPNLQSSGLIPPIQVGSCTIDGGSAGVFTLTKDSALNDLVVRTPLITSVGDLMLGNALDGPFNNGGLSGCMASTGGNICSESGRKQVAPIVTGSNTLGPLQTNQFGNIVAGAPNLISWAPHPNPPALVFPPLCVTPFLGTQEPSSVDNNGGPTGLGTVVGNQLAPAGDPFGDPNADPPVRPSGLLTAEQNSFFLGPSQGIPPGQGTSCVFYQIRQQVGHFLYVVDRQRGEVVVFNSNRMTVIDRISTPDPTSLAMGTNLDFLAVSNQQADVVSFIDINPNSSNFHQVVKTTAVGDSPRGLAWDPGNEDILVCNEGDSSLSIISCFSFEVRKTVNAQLNGPFEVAITPRQTTFGFFRLVYFAYVLNREGTVAIFESGPNGVNGWGFDDIVGVAPFEFRNPKTIQPDPLNLNASVWVVHEGRIDPISGQAGDLGEGAISNLLIESAFQGVVNLNTGGTTGVTSLRDLAFGIRVSIGENRLSGVPVDLAFDNLRNLGGLINLSSVFSAGSAIPQNGKNIVRSIPPGVTVNTNEASYMFAAVPNAVGGSGVVDVIQLGASGLPRVDTNPFQSGVQSIPASNVTLVADYWRQ